MSQGKPSSLSPRLLHGGASLLRSFPVAGKNTFKPSGNPDKDPPEIPSEGEMSFAPQTPEARDKWDAIMPPEWVKRAKVEGRHYERFRFKNTSLRSRKRALRREAKQAQ